MTRKTTFIIIALALLCSCGPKAVRYSDRDVADILSQMRSDPALKAFADSMGVEQLGEGTVCLDPVKHLYRRGARHFLYNEDWGGVLELPQGWIPEDDLWQAEFSFHGTRVWSPDSTVLLCTYAGYSDGPDEDLESEARRLADQGFTVTSQSLSYVPMGDLTVLCTSIGALGEDGIVYYGRTVHSEILHVAYSVSLQYPQGEEERVAGLMPFVDRYPLSPEGKAPVGDAIL